MSLVVACDVDIEARGNECRDVTSGKYEDEKASCEHFDKLAIAAGWIVHKEVVGECRQPRLGVEHKSHYRIDRILEPTPALWRGGWVRGFVGVEIKRSKEKLGPVIAQVMDYSRCAWLISGGRWVECEFNFIFPCEKVSGNTLSIMTSQKIGAAAPRPDWEGDKQVRLALIFCGRLCHFHDKTNDISQMGGNKAGSR